MQAIYKRTSPVKRMRSHKEETPYFSINLARFNMIGDKHYFFTNLNLQFMKVAITWADPGDSHGRSWQLGYTTGFRFFAECLRHSAKVKLHSAKPLSSAVLGKEHGKKLIDKTLFAECFFIGHSAKALPRALRALGKEKRPSRRRIRWRWLCRVPTLQALGKDFLFLFF